ncbi:glycosyltransferase family 71 protein [Xylariaceae sp. FL0662B]|nr:glycosyltransferase family 71 protein [Xylariaceae sp. FL0662B]
MFLKSLGPKEGRHPPGLLSPTFTERSRRDSKHAKYAMITLTCILIVIYILDSEMRFTSTRTSVTQIPAAAEQNTETIGNSSQHAFEGAGSQKPPISDHIVPGDEQEHSNSILDSQDQRHEAALGKATSKLERWQERPSFQHSLQHVLSMLPDEVHMRELIRPIESGGEERMRELGLRTRMYRAYLEAWEQLHFVEDEAGETYLRDDIIQYLRATYKTLGTSELHENTVDGLTLAGTIRNYESFRAFMANYANLLFPWTSPYFSDHMSLHAHFKKGGRGIVLTAGDRQAPYLLTAIFSFRKLGCDLPIEVMYLGDSDLGEDYRFELEDLPGVTTRDISQMVNDEDWTLAGWAAKPFAILLSSFREVILIDADSLFFKNPEVLFEDPDYQETGTLFFKDRLVMPESKKGFLQQIMPKPVPKPARKSRLWTGESGHMQESGVVMIDKWRHFVALLLICRLNGSDRDTRNGRKGVYELLYGDKETFWIGFLLSGDESYAFHQGDTGAMGILELPKAMTESDDMSSGIENGITDPEAEPAVPENYTICSPQLLHLDTDGKPLWFNGWLLDNKFADKSRSKFVELKSYLIEPRELREPVAWQIGSSNMCCLTSDPDKKFDFSVLERDTINMVMKRARDVGAGDY